MIGTSIERNRLRRWLGAGSVGSAALLVASLTILSTLTGFVRELLIGRSLGATGDTDAFFAAFATVSFMFLLLTGGALQGAFMPAYQTLRSRGDDGAARSLLVWTSILVGGLGTILALVLYLWAGSVITLIYPGFSAELHATATLALKILSPIVAFALLGNIAQSVFNARNSFAAPAVIPVITNLIVVGFMTTVVTTFGVQALTLGYFVGYLPWLLLLAFALSQSQHEVGKINSVTKHTMLTSLTLLTLLSASDQLSGLVQRSLLSWYEPGILSAFAYGSRLAGIPISILIGALSVVLFPRFVAIAAEDKDYGASAIVYVSIASTLAVIVPVSLFMAVEAGAIVRILFAESAMDATAVERVVIVFISYALALPAQALIIILSRIYIAASQNRALLVISAAFGMVQIGLTYLGTIWLGWQGVPIATLAYSYLFCAMLLVFLARFSKMYIRVYARGAGTLVLAVAICISVGMLRLGDGLFLTAAHGLLMIAAFIGSSLLLGERSVLQLFRSDPPDV